MNNLYRVCNKLVELIKTVFKKWGCYPKQFAEKWGYYPKLCQDSDFIQIFSDIEASTVSEEETHGIFKGFKNIFIVIG